jgi:hypothetical protein
MTKYLKVKNEVERLLRQGWTELGVKEIYPELWATYTRERLNSKENSMQNIAKEYRTAGAEVNSLVLQGLSLEEIAREHPIIWQMYSQGPPAEKEASPTVKLCNGKVPSAEVYRLQQEYVESGEAKDAVEATKLIAQKESELYEAWQKGGI